MTDQTPTTAGFDDHDDDEPVSRWGVPDDIVSRYAAGVKILLDVCDAHPGTGGAIRCARVVLGCWNGSDHPIDLGGVDSLDRRLRDAALDVIVGHVLTGREAHVFGGEARIRALAAAMRPKRRNRR